MSGFLRGVADDDERMGRSHELSLRAVSDADVDVFFEFQRDPESVEVAAFPARDREAHRAHWARILADDRVILRTIHMGDVVVGNIQSWKAEGRRLVGYWIGRDYWGRGIATAALKLFLAELDQRPLFAFVATANVGSIRVLEKCGFIVSSGTGPVVGDDGVEEFLYELT